MKQCKDCHYYEEHGEGRNGTGQPVTVGLCYRYPPQVAYAGSSYPTVGAIERECGEFKPQKGPRK